MRIFQLRNNGLEEIGEEKSNGKYFGLEKTIQALVENNLDAIFSGLEFIETEFQIDDLRPDTIAFDTEKSSFVIIEYKNVENRSLIDQVRGWFWYWFWYWCWFWCRFWCWL